MNGLYIGNTQQWSDSIPTHLEDFLFSPNALGARFQRLRCEAQSNLYADQEKLRIYLGTYFPRSFCESRNLHTLLLGLDPVRQLWSQKRTIHILDFGSGTGGNVCGLVQALADSGIKAKVHVYSIDGNKEALMYQRILLEHMQEHIGITVDSTVINEVFPNDPEGFSQKFRQVVATLPHQLDLIMAWKSLSELFISDQTSFVGSYTPFFEISAPLLAQDGLMTVLDVTIKARQKWLPVVLSKDLRQFLNNQTDVGLIIPFGCAQRQDHCPARGCYPKFEFSVSHQDCGYDPIKFSFFALGRKDLAKSILKRAPVDAPCQDELGKPAEVASRLRPLSLYGKIVER